MKTILVAVDHGRGSTRIIATVLALAQRQQTKVVLLHVEAPQPIRLNTPGLDVAGVAGMLRELRRRTTRQLLALGRRCENAGCQVQAVQLGGDAVTTILAQAAAERADLIVMGSHGHGAAYELIIGSTTQGVLRRSRRPVLVVPLNGPTRGIAGL